MAAAAAAAAAAASYYYCSANPVHRPPPLRFFPSSSHRPIPKPIKTASRIASASLFAAGAGLALALPSLASPALQEPANALSLPTWAVHVSSVIEWVTAMVLVWEYGEKSGFETWKGLSWGMVPLLGGAMCACTWHFFYNSEELEVLVAIQGALTVLGNLTMCIAAFRIFRAIQEGSENP